MLNYRYCCRLLAGDGICVSPDFFLMFKYVSISRLVWTLKFIDESKMSTDKGCSYFVSFTTWWRRMLLILYTQMRFEYFEANTYSDRQSHAEWRPMQYHQWHNLLLFHYFLTYFLFIYLFSIVWELDFLCQPFKEFFLSFIYKLKPTNRAVYKIKKIYTYLKERLVVFNVYGIRKTRTAFTVLHRCVLNWVFFLFFFLLFSTDWWNTFQIKPSFFPLNKMLPEWGSREKCCSYSLHARLKWLSSLQLITLVAFWRPLVVCLP